MEVEILLRPFIVGCTSFFVLFFGSIYKELSQLAVILGLSGGAWHRLSRSLCETERLCQRKDIMCDFELLWEKSELFWLSSVSSSASMLIKSPKRSSIPA